MGGSINGRLNYDKCNKIVQKIKEAKSNNTAPTSSTSTTSAVTDTTSATSISTLSNNASTTSIRSTVSVATTAAVSIKADPDKSASASAKNTSDASTSAQSEKLHPTRVPSRSTVVKVLTPAAITGKKQLVLPGTLLISKQDNDPSVKKKSPLPILPPLRKEIKTTSSHKTVSHIFSDDITKNGIPLTGDAGNLLCLYQFLVMWRFTNGSAIGYLVPTGLNLTNKSTRSASSSALYRSNANFIRAQSST